MAELRYLLKVDTLTNTVKTIEDVFVAVSRLKMVDLDETGLEVLQALESETSYRKGKGQKIKPVVHTVQLEVGNLDNLLSSPDKSAPKLVAILKEDEVVNFAVVADSVYVLIEATSVVTALAVLMGIYYLADLDYPKTYSQVLGFLQQTVFLQQYEGHKTHGFIQFLKRVTAHIENAQIKK